MATFTTFQKPSDKSSHVSEAPRSKSHKHPIPETKGTSEGSSKRNIVRKERTGSGHGSKKEDILDDGSSVLLEPLSAPSVGDPLYDEEDERGGYVFVSEDGAEINPKDVVFTPVMTLAEFKKSIKGALDEYFSAEDSAEMLRQITELECPHFNYEVVKFAISTSLDRNERERELVSRLVRAMVPDIMSLEECQKGFERVLEMVDDYEIDVPGATLIVASFLARAVVDEVLPPRFFMDPMIASIGGDAMAEARSMLSRDHQYSRIEKIWGPGDGRPAEELKASVNLLLQEFIQSQSFPEAERCVIELQSPHFHHELVKRAIVLAMDQEQSARKAILDLLIHLNSQEILFESQIVKGLERVRDQLDDLVLDSPCAAEVLEYYEQGLKMSEPAQKVLVE